MFFDKKVFLLSFTFICLGVLFSARATKAATYLDDPITIDTTLTVEGSPYILEHSIQISHAVLNIEAGVHIGIDDIADSRNQRFLLYDAHIHMMGTRDNPIYLDGVSLDCDGSSTADIQYVTIRTTSDFPAIYLTNDSYLTADAVTISHVKAGISIAGNSSAHLTHVSIDDAGDCIAIDHSFGTLPEEDRPHFTHTNEFFMHDSTLSNCLMAVRVTSVDSFDFAYNRLVHNTLNLTISNDTPLDIAHNWWGSSVGPQGTVVGDYSLGTWLTMDPLDTRNPVISIPGILGTTMVKKDSQEEVWPAARKLITSMNDSFLDSLTLNSDGTVNPDTQINTGDIVRSFGLSIGPVSPVFSNLIDQLTSDGYAEGASSFVFPYDWRMSVPDTSIRLHDFITDVLNKTGKSKVVLIAHSMGGLVAQEYEAVYGFGSVAQNIFIGTPHLGSPKVFKALMYGDDMGIRVGPISLLAPAIIKKISQNMPAVYDLLPSKTYVEGDISHKYVYDSRSSSAFDYDAIRQYLIDSGRNPNLFGQAESLHAFVDQQTFSNVPTYNFVGCGATKTITDITLRKNKKNEDDYMLRYGNGDDTVPVYSATFPNTINYYVRGSSHSELPSESAVVASVSALLSGRQLDMNQQGLSTDSNTCFVSGTVISKHSPVRMDIYDTEGRHTGPTADGSIEYGIPDVAYDMLGGDTFSFLPSGREYRVTETPTDVGSYDLYIQKIAPDDTVLSEKHWDAIPIFDLKSVSQITITDQDIAPVVQMDTDGDGVFDIDYHDSGFVPVENVHNYGHPVLEESQETTIPTSVSQLVHVSSESASKEGVEVPVVRVQARTIKPMNHSKVHPVPKSKSPPRTYSVESKSYWNSMVLKIEIFLSHFLS